ncbi:MAG: hypothetical protein ACXAAH_06895 [Promethearchaeota archaeon]|jgi:hypothetical protein
MNRKICFLIVSILLFSYILELNIFSITSNVQGLEFENIDSFDIDVDFRWNNILSESTPTLSVDSSLLNYSDIGISNQGSANSRSLKRLDATIEGRFQIPTFDLSYNPYNLTDALFHFPLDEGLGSTTTDSINGYIGTLNNNPQWSSSSFTSFTGDSVFFNLTGGTGSEIDCGDIGDDIFLSGTNTVDKAGSISFWFKINTTQTHTDPQYDLIGQWNNTSSENMFLITYNTVSDYFSITLENGDSGQNNARIGRRTADNSLTSSNDGKWQYLTFTYSGNEASSGLNIYLNGSDIDSTDNDFFPGNYNGLSDHNDHFRISSELTFQTENITIDEVIAYNISLTPTQVLDFYNQYLDDRNGKAQTQIGFTDRELTFDSSLPDVVIICEVNDTVLKVGFTSNSVLYTKVISNILIKETWLRFKIDLNIFESDIDFEIDFDNGTNLSKTNYLEISTNRPDIFETQMLDIFYGVDHGLDGNGTINYFIDFLKAPYKEFDWQRFGNAPSGNVIESDSEFGIVAVSDTTDTNFISVYQLAVPEFDSISGVMYISTNETDESNLNLVKAFFSFSTYGIFANNGSSVELGTITIGFINRDDQGQVDNTFADPRVRINNASGTPIGGPYIFSNNFGGSGTSMEEVVEMGYVIYRSSDTNLTMQISMIGESFTWNFDVSPYSSEFLFRSSFEIETDSSQPDIEYKMGMKDVQLQYRADWGDLLPKLPSFNPGDVVGAIVDFFLAPIRILGNIITGTFSFIMNPIATFINDILSLVTDIVVDIFDVLVSTALDILDAFIDAAIVLLDNLADLVGGIFSATYDFLIEPLIAGALLWIDRWIFAVNELLTLLVDSYEFVDTFLPLITLALTVYIFGFTAMDNRDDPSGWILDIIKRSFINMTEGLTFFGIGIPLPLIIPWWLLAQFYGWTPW